MRYYNEFKCPDILREQDTARAFRYFVNDKVAFCPERGFFFYSEEYDDEKGKHNAHWCEDESALIVSRMLQDFANAMLSETAEAMENADSLPHEEADFLKEKLKYSLKIRDARTHQAILSFVKSQCSVSAECFDAEQTYDFLNTYSGIVDLRTGEIDASREINHYRFITRVAPHRVSNKGAAEWQEFLDQLTLGDRELQEFLQCLAGASAFGRVYSDCLYILLGNGSNGKSTFTNLLLSVLNTGRDGYAVKLPSQIFQRDQFASMRFQFANLRGARLAVASELQSGLVLDEASLKYVCSRDKMVADRKFKTAETFTPTHTMWLTLNKLPSLPSTDYGTRRRICVIPFSASFVGREDVKNKEQQILKTSAESILKWVIDGAVKFCQNGYTLPSCQAVEEATENYLADSDTVIRWLKDRTERDPSSKLPLNQLYVDYEQYTTERPLDRFSFKNRLKEERYLKLTYPQRTDVVQGLKLIYPEQ